MSDFAVTAALAEQRGLTTEEYTRIKAILGRGPRHCCHPERSEGSVFHTGRWSLSSRRSSICVNLFASVVSNV